MNQSQGGAAAARRVHTPEVAGSTPALATQSALAGGEFSCVCRANLKPPIVVAGAATARFWPWSFFEC